MSKLKMATLAFEAGFEPKGTIHGFEGLGHIEPTEKMMFIAHLS